MFQHLPKKRRTVLKSLLAGSAAMFLAPFAYAVDRYLSFTGAPMAGASVKLNAADLTPSSPALDSDIAGEPIVVVRQPDNVIRAFTSTCTHMGCTVHYRASSQDFFCKCHRGRFDRNGINVPGTKPPSPLTELVVKQEADDLEIFLTPKTTTGQTRA